MLAAAALIAAGCGATGPEQPEAGAVVTDVASQDAAESPTITTAPTTADPSGAAPSDSAPTPSAARQVSVAAVELAASIIYLDPAEIETRLASITTPAGYDDVAQQILEEVGPMRESLAALEPSVVWSTNEALSAEVNVEGSSATAEVWTVRLFSRQDAVEPQMEFVTYTFGLEFTDSGWKIGSWSFVPGPAVRLSFSSDPVTALELDRMLDGHRLVESTGGV